MTDRRRTRWIRVRIAALGLLVLGAAGVVLARAWQVQVVRADDLRRRAERQYLTARRLAPKRGTVFDRHGMELAVSVDVESVFVDPRELASAAGAGAEAERVRVARTLSRLLGLDPAETYGRVARDRAFVWIARHVTPKQARAVAEAHLPGVHLVSESRRFYPNRELAAHVLGFANVDGVGIEGLELALDPVLRGSGAAATAIQDARRRVVFSPELLEGQSALGHDVVLTIDRTIQRIAERELELAVGTFEAAAASVVVVDPATGEILAMANAPGFNPNDPAARPPEARRNRAITDRFEPGSTVKPFTLAGALAAGALRPTQRVDCGDGSLQIADVTIHDTGRWGWLTPAEILAVSSNIGTARVGTLLGREGLFRTLRRFGFGEPTGLLLPGETGGRLPHYRRWYEMDAATIAFGQGMSVTTLQLAMATAALANGGRLMSPVLVDRVVDATGRVIESSLPRTRRRVVPERVAALLAEMMTAVTGPNGTGEEAAVEGYLVAGKTGTAQKAAHDGPGYARDRWLASFVGFVPADAPRLAIAVVVDEPVIANAGGSVAAPVFRRVASAALRHLGVPSSHLARSRALARAAGAPPRAERRASPRPEAASGDATAVPDFTGATARRAVVLARRVGLFPRLRGTGSVVSQSPSPGEPLRAGALLELELAPPARPGGARTAGEGAWGAARAAHGRDSGGAT